MNIMQRLLSPKSGKRIEIEITKNVFVNGSRYEVGEIASFPENTAREIVGAGAGFDPKNAAQVQVRAENLAALLPPPGTARDLPENFDKLPSCFADWWQLNEKGLLLLNRRNGIESALIDRVRARCLPDLRGIQNLPRADQGRLLRGCNFDVGPIADEEINAQRSLRDALVRADEAIADWREVNAAELLRLRIACSDHTQDVHGSLCKNLRELHAMALDLFSSRISALGLSEVHTQRLFAGSADAVRFASIDSPMLQDRRLAWIEESGEPRHYLDTPVLTMAELIRGFTATGEAVAKLSTQARKELSAARRVSAAA